MMQGLCRTFDLLRRAQLQAAASGARYPDLHPELPPFPARIIATNYVRSSPPCAGPTEALDRVAGCRRSLALKLALSPALSADEGAVEGASAAPMMYAGTRQRLALHQPGFLRSVTTIARRGRLL